MAGKDLRNLLQKQPLILPGAYNGFSAKQIEQEGFPGVYISGAGLSNGLGVPDDGTLGLQDFLYIARWIVQAGGPLPEEPVGDGLDIWVQVQPESAKVALE